MGDYRRWRSGSRLAGRLRGIILTHQASTKEEVLKKSAVSVWNNTQDSKRNCEEELETE